MSFSTKSAFVMWLKYSVVVSENWVGRIAVGDPALARLVAKGMEPAKEYACGRIGIPYCKIEPRPTLGYTAEYALSYAKDLAAGRAFSSELMANIREWDPKLADLISTGLEPAREYARTRTETK